MATIQSAIKLNDMMSAPIEHIINAMDGMLSAWNDLESATKSGLDVRNMESIRSEIRLASNGLEEMEANQKDFNRQVQNGESAMDGLTDTILGAIGAYAGLQGLKKLVDLSDTYTQTTARLNMINDGLQTTEQLTDKIFASAQRARASYTMMADTVAKLSLNAGDAFASNDETILFAENLNKLFAIAGTEQASIASASLQLTQALGSGVLRGEEFNAVFEAAPNIMQQVANYMGLPIGKLRQMAQEGMITADVVKNALLSATDDINAQFESMPMTWAQVWTGVMNTLYDVTTPILELINWLANNWSTLEPIVIGAAVAIGAYTTALLIYKGVTKAAGLMESVRAAATMMSTGATFAATAAQYGFNAALMACPLTWIILLIIAVIAAIYAVVAAINKVTGSTISATGIIAGTIAVAGAFIMNVVIGVLNAMIQAVWTIFVEPFIDIIEWVLNAANGGFNSFGGAVANLIGQIIGWFLSLGKIVTKIIDAIFGTNWTDGLNSLQDSVTSWGKSEEAITLDRNAPTINHRFEYGDAWNSGYDFGANLFGSDTGTDDLYSQEALMKNLGDIPTYEELANNTGDIADNTAAIKDSLDITNEDLKYLRDLAEQEVINKFTTAEIKVDMTNNNTINNTSDLDGIVTYLGDAIREEMDAMANGVHAY